MGPEQLLKLHKQLLTYNHLHMISENRPLPFKAQKDLWIKIWSLKKRKTRYFKYKQKYNRLDLMTIASYLNSHN